MTCASREFIDSLKNVNNGAETSLGPTMDSLRSTKRDEKFENITHRMKQHSHNAMYLAERFEKRRIKSGLSGLKSHSGHNVCLDD